MPDMPETTEEYSAIQWFLRFVPATERGRYSSDANCELFTEVFAQPA